MLASTRLGSALALAGVSADMKLPATPVTCSCQEDYPYCWSEDHTCYAAPRSSNYSTTACAQQCTASYESLNSLSTVADNSMDDHYWACKMYIIQSGVAGDCVPHSTTWPSCSYDNMHTCETNAILEHCCCDYGYKYDSSAGKCLRRRTTSSTTTSPQGISGSGLWVSCNYDHMERCGWYCCCDTSYIYDDIKEECVEVTTTTTSTTTSPTEISGSRFWASCNYDNMARCGHYCCCDAWYIYDDQKKECLQATTTSTAATTTKLPPQSIPGSQFWLSCKDNNIHTCGWQCCCDAGYVLNEEVKQCESTTTTTSAMPVVPAFLSEAGHRAVGCSLVALALMTHLM